MGEINDTSSNGLITPEQAMVRFAYDLAAANLATLATWMHAIKQLETATVFETMIRQLKTCRDRHLSRVSGGRITIAPANSLPKSKV